MPQGISYNERSWAIDVISEINSYCRTTVRSLARAGGEYTVSNLKKRMFPDVLLFSDRNGSSIQQGWELKMPDTPITDGELLANATMKARRLRLNSFLVWNASDAALYKKLDESEDSEYRVCKTWATIGISSRKDVQQNSEIWKAKLIEILNDINDFIDNGSVVSSLPELAINERLFTDFLELHAESSAALIESATRRSNTLKEKIAVWWTDNQKEYGGATQFLSLARINLVNWINRFLFAHYLKGRYSHANTVDTISNNTSIDEANEIFLNISSRCDFINVFRSDNIGQNLISPEVWGSLIGINKLLRDFRLNTIPHESFQHILDKALIASRRKLAGQFSTPENLAELITRITVEDWTKNIIDPCCGSGTIGRLIYRQKRLNLLNPPEALQTTWASDKYSFPLLLCTIALSDRDAIGEIVQVFRKDAFLLSLGNEESFTNPATGDISVRRLPLAHAVVSNLPFVRFEDAKKLNPIIAEKEVEINSGLTTALSKKSDLYTYLIFQLKTLLEDNGRIGVIISNSWLGTEWGALFRKALLGHFTIKRIVISGNGRWFENADVVTTILVLENRLTTTPPTDTESIDFITTYKPIEEWALGETMNSMVRSVILHSATHPSTQKRSYTLSQIASLEVLGIEWSALFANTSWLNQVSHCLVPASNYFSIARGERRGCNPFFYLESQNSVETQFIQPVLKSTRHSQTLLATADGQAFCCSLPLDQMDRANCRGAREWIRRFDTQNNRKKLARSGLHWYEMRPSTLADLVLSMNPDKKLAIHRLPTRSFVDQRLIRFTAIEEHNIAICHALLNSAIGMFMIEAAGFGRGLGVLDLNATKLADSFHMLNPGSLSSAHKQSILNAFQPLLRRNIFNLFEEIEQLDRQAFDRVVAASFGISNETLNAIYSSLQELHSIRQTARGELIVEESD